MQLIQSRRGMRGLGVANEYMLGPNFGAGNSASPIIVGRFRYNPGASPTLPTVNPTGVSSSPAVGATSQDSSGNTYTWNGSSWVLTLSASGTPTAAAPGTAAATPSTPYIGQTWTDSMGNVYTYSSAGWQLTSSAASGTVPSVASATATASTVGFPANPVVGQTYTDPSGNIWTYSSTGWQETTAASGTDWLTQESIISGVENYWIVGAGVLALIFLMKGKR